MDTIILVCAVVTVLWVAVGAAVAVVIGRGVDLADRRRETADHEFSGDRAA